MHVSGELGFASLVLAVICVVVPAIACSVRRKRRIAVARKEKIKRLLVLASEESARAEFEAVCSYGVVSSLSNSVARNNYQCAVCFSPTTKICARCKSVRYCSGKCQIVHWRKGHKEECQPNSTSYRDKHDGCNLVSNLSKQEQHVNYSEGYEKSSVATSTKSLSSDSCCNSKVTHNENDNVKVDHSEDTGHSSPISESSGASFSGFSTSPSCSESSDDVSVVGNISSNEAERCDGQESADTGLKISESLLENLVQTKPLSPKFACLVDSVDSFSKLGKSKQSTPSSFENKRVGSLAKSIDITCNSSVTFPGKISSGFWDRAIDSVAINDPQDGSAPESFLRFKFNVSGSSASSSHTKSPENISGTQGTRGPVDTGVVSEDTGVNAPKVRSLPSSSREVPRADNDATDSKISSSSESRSASSLSADKDLLRKNATKGFRSPSMSSDSSNPVTDEIESNSLICKSKISPPASQASLPSRPSSHSVSCHKFGKVDNVETCSSHSSPMISSSSSISGLKSSVWKVVDQFKGSKSGRYSDKGLFPYDLFVKLYTSCKVEMWPCGLINCGNSCYANSVLQCLAFTPPFTAYFVQGLHSKSCVNKEWCFTCEFEKLILKAKEGKSPLSPSAILSQQHNIGSKLGNGREEDAHEFLRYAIDVMQAVCLKEAGVNASGSIEEETSLVGLTFGGYLRSKIKCMKCQHKSERQERMMDLTVEIGGDIDRLEDALKRFTGTEILDGENKYQCNRCKSYEKAKKKLTILEAPNVLTIALKRFQSGKFGKLNKPICFPEILDLAPYMSGTSDKSPIYRLYGVVVHLDIMNTAFSGHYVCYVKNAQNKWFKIDDSTVTPVELERVLAKGAYILLYARCLPRSPRLLRNPPSKISAKNTLFSSRSTSACSNVVYLQPNLVPSDNTGSVESFYLNRLQRILEEDSSSDNFSFTSSNSDEGSCSTDSTRDSTSTDDLSDYIFGGWNSPWKSLSDSDTSSSSSPLYASHSPQTNSYKAGQANRGTEDDLWDGLTSRSSRLASSAGAGGESLPHSDAYKQCIKLDSSRSCRETDAARLGSVNPFDDVIRRVSFRRSMSERSVYDF